MIDDSPQSMLGGTPRHGKLHSDGRLSPSLRELAEMRMAEVMNRSVSLFVWLLVKHGLELFCFGVLVGTYRWCGAHCRCTNCRQFKRCRRTV
jgi:hypothetical protein